MQEELIDNIECHIVQKVDQMTGDIKKIGVRILVKPYDDKYAMDKRYLNVLPIDLRGEEFSTYPPTLSLPRLYLYNSQAKELATLEEAEAWVDKLKSRVLAVLDEANIPMCDRGVIKDDETV